MWVTGQQGFYREHSITQLRFYCWRKLVALLHPHHPSPGGSPCVCLFWRRQMCCALLFHRMPCILLLLMSTGGFMSLLLMWSLLADHVLFSYSHIHFFCVFSITTGFQHFQKFILSSLTHQWHHRHPSLSFTRASKRASTHRGRLSAEVTCYSGTHI